MPASDFGLTISMSKTEVVCCNGRDRYKNILPHITANDQPLKSAKLFKYLGGIITEDGRIDQDIANRICKASQSFGRLMSRVWDKHNITIEAKMSLYRAVVFSTLPYGFETWTLYERHKESLNQCHQRRMRRILGVKWDDRTTNNQVWQRAELPEIAVILQRGMLRRAGHIVRMKDARFPKQALYGELPTVKRKLGRPKLRFKDNIKSSMKHYWIRPDQLQIRAQDRPGWRKVVRDGSERWRSNRIEERMQTRLRRKQPQLAAQTGLAMRGLW